MALRFDAAVFDMDGTLLDSMRYWRFTSLEYMLRHGLPVKEEFLNVMIQTSSRKLLSRTLTEMGVPFDIASVIRELEGYMERHYEKDVSPKPGALQFMRGLARRGVKIVIASAVYREIVEKSMKIQGMWPYVDFITDSVELGMGKASPEYFAALCRRMGVSPQRTMVFEDALYAIKGAKEAGCLVCAVEDETGINNREEIKSLCDRLIVDYRELLNEADFGL